MLTAVPQNVAVLPPWFYSVPPGFAGIVSCEESFFIAITGSNVPTRTPAARLSTAHLTGEHGIHNP